MLEYTLKTQAHWGKAKCLSQIEAFERNPWHRTHCWQHCVNLKVEACWSWKFLSKTKRNSSMAVSSQPSSMTKTILDKDFHSERSPSGNTWYLSFCRCFVGTLFKLSWMIHSGPCFAAPFLFTNCFQVVLFLGSPELNYSIFLSSIAWVFEEMNCMNPHTCYFLKE